ncbi:hypothetical protein E2C01_065404 [Portunus trituberculatus]|uniref:Uncharacterized protein n=1 Tax=Portunus trituberculatus TaxID=210409 RepID=A0A5B7HRN1_PORTR|nr:hypothetical protein [Portunus trituberculatus]
MSHTSLPPSTIRQHLKRQCAPRARPTKRLQLITMGREKLNMEGKICALTLLEQGMPGKCVVEELKVNKWSIYRLKMEAAKLGLNTTPPQKPNSGDNRKTTPKTDCILKCEVKKNHNSSRIKI